MVLKSSKYDTVVIQICVFITCRTCAAVIYLVFIFRSQPKFSLVKLAAWIEFQYLSKNNSKNNTTFTDVGSRSFIQYCCVFAIQFPDCGCSNMFIFVILIFLKYRVEIFMFWLSKIYFILLFMYTLETSNFYIPSRSKIRMNFYQ